MKPNQYLKACRDRLGIESNYALAQRWAVSQQRLSDYENGKRMPDMKARILIAQTLEIPLEVVATDPDLQWPQKPRKPVGEVTLRCLLVAFAVTVCLMGAASTSAYASGRMHIASKLSNSLHDINYAILELLKRRWRTFWREHPIAQAEIISPLLNAVRHAFCN